MENFIFCEVNSRAFENFEAREFLMLKYFNIYQIFTLQLELELEIRLRI